MPGRKQQRHLAANAAFAMHHSDWFIPDARAINAFFLQDQFVDALQNLGWYKVGQGGFSVVLRHDQRPWLLKIFSSDNQKWLQYMRWARDHRDNVHIPRTHGQMNPITADFWAVRMESLLPIYHSEFFLKFVDPGLVQKVSHCTDALDAMYWHHRPENRHWLQQHWPDIAEVLDGLQVVLGFPELDLNMDNLMRRGDTLVYTDPV